MLKSYISKRIIEEIKFDPTGCQTEMADKVGEFITVDQPHQLFLLRGYAGTGKTTSLRSEERRVGKEC